ncbi:hypothetical protein OG884_18665 [Streptosporangium sp. NBC_01755]|uniref:hypothetical protein n=1 Tax=unclassified Streptosporangium TaxID=2632669 RepID=UPI002DDBD4E2|nr:MULTISPECIES: hypothetical protein [unclassified Streptosporangium]WSA23709.1 hypothetical protein OIE13_22470 [Streptosporangium sp. NBC_01810]WSD03831.1 hypothetical protein OG884_18665 [Streptosporangium sp. NBC_01755]
MRIQIFPLPHVVVGEVVEQPFALVVDQYDAPTTEEEFDRWQHFKQECGARAVLVTPETVEVVDRYAEPAAPQEPVSGNADALRDLARLAEYVYDNFPDGAAQGGGTIVDVAMRLLGELPHHRDAGKLTAGWPKLHRDRSEDDA